MDCQNLIAINYLMRFDEILCTMKSKMLSNCFIDDITTYFVKCMIPHHQAAIYMCENLLYYTCNEPLIEICRNIIKTQEAGIEKMQEIACTTSGFFNNNEEINCYMSSYLGITKNMIYKMEKAPRCINLNLNFVNEMIPHHEGAIAMCSNLLKYNIDSRLKNVAQSIISKQSQGVRNLTKVHNNICYN